MVIGCGALPGLALAQGWVDEYSYDFSSVEVGEFSGTAGWATGWGDDPWTTSAYPGEVNPLTDEGGGQWSGSAPITNHLLQTDAGSWADAGFEAQAAIYDDDTLGLVLRRSAAATFYLFFMTTDLGPSDGAGGDGRYLVGSFLYRVEAGIAEQVAANTSATYFEDQGQVDYQRLRLEAVGGTVTAYYSDQESGAWSSDDVVLEFEDDDPLPAGTFGFYAYEMGSYSGLVGFKDPLLQLYDGDGDGWVNDLDCEPDDGDSHPEAAEDCGDGIDNDCDGDVDGDDTDCGGDDDTGDDDTGDDDTGDDDTGDDDTGDDDAAGDDDDDADEGITLVGGDNDCVCRAADGRAGAVPTLAALALLAWGVRRRLA